MRTGWEIVIVGEDVVFADFFRRSTIRPCRIGTRKTEGPSARRDMRAVEFTDWREGSYPLDAVTEALDYLRTHQTEFETLLQLPGIEGHYLNIVAAVGPGTSAEAFELDAEDIALLASMGFAVSIAVQRTEKDRE